MADLNTLLAQANISDKVQELSTKYQIDLAKLAAINQILSDYIQGQVSEAALAGVLEEKAQLDFNIAVDFAYDLVEQIVPLLPQEIQAKLFPAIAGQEFDLAAMLENIKKEAVINLPANLDSRFADLIYSWFRGIRDDWETLDRLTLSSKIGGLALPYEQAQKILASMNKIKQIAGKDIVQAIEKERAQKAKEPLGIVEEEIDVSAKPQPKIELEKITGQETTIEQLLADKGMAYDDLVKKAYASQPQPQEESHPVISENPVVEDIIKEEEFLESHEELTPPQDLPIKEDPPVTPEAVKYPLPEAPKDIMKELGLPEPEPLWKQRQAQASEPEVKAVEFVPAPAPTQPTEEKSSLYRKPDLSERPRMEDVKTYGAPRLYGPIDELAALSLIDFRRLSKDPLKAADIIRQKLEVLENDSLEKRAAGIKALKNSPLYKIYADVMNKAFMNNQSADQVIAQRGDITTTEYKAIMDLNKSLKY